MKRREFLSSSLALAAAGVAPRSAQAAGGSIEILMDEPIGRIAPEFHGQFTEHLGGCIYDGIWVGENSKIPNEGGIRKALVDRMRQMEVPVDRWPGGCFADSYNWRDGIGTQAERPVRTNFWANTRELRNAPDGPQKYEPNTFGTPEFMRFCQLAGAKPYFAANVRSLTPFDFYQWVEYCNSPAGSTTLATQRAADGSKDPYNVLYWGVGNESWGCGGNFTPQEYATEFRRFTTWMANFGLRLHLIGSGPGTAIDEPAVDWTRGLFEGLAAKGRDQIAKMWGLSLHYYCWTTGNGSSIDFDVPGWYQMLWQADAMDSILPKHWLAMGELDTEHHVKLVVDEWGAWHKGPSIAPSYLFSYPPSLRNALVTGITLDIFNRHAEKLAMCNAAQLINNIHTSFLALEDRFTVTPIFWVFDMYKAHRGGHSLRFVADAPSISYSYEGKSKSLWGLAGSASLHQKKKKLVVTVVNPHASEERTTEIVLRGASARSGKATVLTHSDIHAHNTFEHPDAVHPTEAPANVSGSRFTWTFKPASVTKLEIELA
jgi:alpha-N-arabinofuranosidase